MSERVSLDAMAQGLDSEELAPVIDLLEKVKQRHAITIEESERELDELSGDPVMAAKIRERIQAGLDDMASGNVMDGPTFMVQLRQAQCLAGPGARPALGRHCIPATQAAMDEG